MRAANSWANGDAGTESEGQVLGRPTEGVGKEGPNRDASRAGCFAKSQEIQNETGGHYTSTVAQDP